MWAVKQNKYHHNLSKGFTKALTLVNNTAGIDWSANNSWVAFQTPLAGDFTVEWIQCDDVATVTGFRDAPYTAGTHYGTLNVGIQFHSATTATLWQSGGATTISATDFINGTRIKLSRVGSVCNVYINGVLQSSPSVSTATMYMSGTFNSSTGFPLTILNDGSGGPPQTLTLGTTISREFPKIPGRGDGFDATGLVTANPSGAFHNMAESNLHLAQNVAAPGSTGELVAWRPDMLRSPYDLDSANWDVSGSINRKPYGTYDPEGGKITASSLVDVAALDYHFCGQAIVVPAGTYTIEATVQANGTDHLGVHVSDGNAHTASFNVATGVVTDLYGSCTGSATPLGSSWFKLVATFTTTAPTYYIYLILQQAGPANYYTGTGTGGVLVGRVSMYAGNPRFFRWNTKSDYRHRADRIVKYSQSLTGNRLTAASKFTQSKAIT